jgi:hypothetical protein
VLTCEANDAISARPTACRRSRRRQASAPSWGYLFVSRRDARCRAGTARYVYAHLLSRIDGTSPISPDVVARLQEARGRPGPTSQETQERIYTLERMHTPPLSLLRSGKWGTWPAAGLSGNHAASPT